MFSFTEAQLLGWLTPILWPTMRMLALLASLPVFSQRVVPMRVKLGLAVFIALSAQAALASARLQRIQAQLDWNVYRATLAQSVGALDYTLLQAAAEGRP